MSKVVNLAKGRTYICTCASDTKIIMGSGSSAIEVTIEAPQGLFVATAEVGTVSNEAAVLKQLFYSSAASGIGAKPIKLATSFDKEDNTKAVSGKLVADYIEDTIGPGFKAEIVTSVPAVEDAVLNTIYMVPGGSGEHEEGDTYDEWLKVLKNGTYIMEKIGTTALKVQNYLRPTDMYNPVTGHAVANYTVNSLRATGEHREPVSDYALYFLNSSDIIKPGRPGTNASLALTYFTQSQERQGGQRSDFIIKQHDIGGSNPYTTIGYNYYWGGDTKSYELSLTDLAVSSNYGFIQEPNSDVPDAENVYVGGNFIDERVKAILDSRKISLINLRDKLAAGAVVLKEDDIGYIATQASATSLEGVSCQRLATAEIWIDVKANTNTQIEFPSNATWLMTQPTTLTAGKRYVFVVRNDTIPTEGDTEWQPGDHLVFNLAYSYTI